MASDHPRATATSATPSQSIFFASIRRPDYSSRSLPATFGLRADETAGSTLEKENRIMTIKPILALGVLSACAFLTACTQAPRPTTVDRVDLDRYAGRWYEVAR